MAEALISLATDAILGKVTSMVKEETKLAWGFKGELERLGKRLVTAQALLHDAQNREMVNVTSVQLWLKKLRIIASDADDVLEEFDYERLRRKLELMNELCNFFSLSNPLVFHLKMAHRVRDINLSLDQIYKEATTELGLTLANSIISSRNEPQGILRTRTSHPYVDHHSELVGRDNDVISVVNMLVEECGNVKAEEIPVVAVVGLGGLGKTALTQLVYKHGKVNSYFDKKMWVYVSDRDFNVERLLNEMTLSLGGTKSDTSNVEGTIKILQEKINGKKYLLVLDDVWNKNRSKWLEMRNALLALKGDVGSRVLVTTRLGEVVSTIGTPLSYRLQGLSDEHSWKMFRRRAFSTGGPVESPFFTNVGKSILKRCSGVPLAINSLAGLMHSMKNEHEWLSVQKSEVWDLPDNDDELLPALMLSFNHLPSQSLKQCFAYLSIFPKGYDIGKNETILLWMAQGYLQLQLNDSSHLSGDELGSYYFNVLLWNSLLQEAQEDDYGNITSCKMHDLVHDLARHVAKNNCLTNLKNIGQIDNGGFQHLSLTSIDEDDFPSLAVVKEGFRRLRTLRSPHVLFQDTLEDFKGLRALLVIDSSSERLPESIGKLKLLKYLDASGSDFKSLPDCITRLYNLETLRISGCSNLEELPKKLYKLFNLRHFYVDNTQRLRNQMPERIGQLTHLQTLPFFVVGQEDGHQIEELGFLNNLRGEVKIYGLEQVKSKEDAQKANLACKTQVKRLRFEWGSGTKQETNKDEEVLEGLKPHSYLRGLAIENYNGEKIASWMVSPTSVLCCLVNIQLRNCNSCKQMPTLGTIQSLKFIEIDGMENVTRIGPEFYGDYSDNGVAIFPSLKSLVIKNMAILTEWCEADKKANVFPLLEELKIEGCENLVSMPGHFPSVKKLRLENFPKLTCLPKGIQFPFSLEELEIINCPKLVVSNTKTQNPTSIKILELSGLETLTTDWAQFLLSLTCLNTLSMGKFIRDDLECFPWPEPDQGRSFSFLKNLKLYGWENVKSLSENVKYLTALRELDLVDFCGLESLPDWFGNLSSLHTLIVGNATLLSKLPSKEEMQRLTGLFVVKIDACPIMYEKLHPQNGPEWEKIAHISLVIVDGEHIKRNLWFDKSVFLFQSVIERK